ncbi:hypothetical protein ABID29_002436 [Streptococcus rupicaprae]|uniref:Uncharacterized protein n=1 Tax=Streptococcus rupicaprae TaxID=759619 RepID=A0ABV2FL60_9STRE
METLYYQLDDMLSAGFSTPDQFVHYCNLKQTYEEATQDYSFSAREIMGQLERLLDDRDFPDVDSALVEEYLDLVKKLENYDKSRASYYLKFFVKVV